MGKTYVDIVKYLIRANIEVNGIVEKPDIVGAIFGQTEGLLGDELDLRELQKNGRIGRIEVDTQIRGGRCIGSVTVPSSLDMVETSILAGALEVVDRVGPCEARISTQKIEDTRNVKRQLVLSRAKELLKNMMTNEIPESKELSEMVRRELQISGVVGYGPESLAAGPEMESSDEILVVEGRADVINLLKNKINNSVAIGGANVGKTISDLCRKKEVTVFLDGDRGGDIILKELLNATEIDFVARAPPGREVEELSRKEIIQALRRREPVEQSGSQKVVEERRNAPGRDRQSRRGSPQREAPRAYRDEPRLAPAAVPEPRPLEPPAPIQPDVPEVDAAIAESLRKHLGELSGSLRARIVGEDGAAAQEVPIRDLIGSLSKTESVWAIVLDGIVTQRLIDLAESKKAKYICGIRAGNITKRPDGIGIVLAQ